MPKSYKEMTCTIGYVDGAVVIIASDSAAVCETTFTIRRGSSKIWRVANGLVIGFAGDFSMCQWIRYIFEWPHLPNCDNDTLHKYLVLCAEKIDSALRQRFAYMTEGLDDWQLLVGAPQTSMRRASLFVIYGNGDVEESAEAYAVIGSGSASALGALYATKTDLTKNAWDHIEVALEASAANDINIKKPWQVLHT